MGWEQDFAPTAQQAPPVPNWQQDFTPNSYSQQPEGQPIANGASASNDNSGAVVNENLQNVAVNQDPLQTMLNYFTEKPNEYHSPFFPMKVDDTTGNPSLGLPEFAMSGGRGLAQLLMKSQGQYPASSDTSQGGADAPLSSDELGALTVFSPSSIATPALSLPSQLAGAMGEGSPYIPLEDHSFSDIGTSALPQPKDSDLKLITSKLSLAGITPEEYADNLVNSGSDQFAAELGGDPLRLQAQSMAKLQGSGMQTARDAMRERLSEAPQRVQGIIDQSIMPQPVIDTMQDNIQGMMAKSNAAYRAANKAEVPLSEFSDVINTPSGQTALKQTAENFANSGKSAEDMGLTLGEDGKYSLNDSIPIETMHQIQQNIGTQVQRDAFGNTLTTPGNQVLERQQTGITSKLASLNPDYKTGLNNAAAYKQAQSAFDAGRQLAHTSASDNADQIMDRASEVYSPNELSYHKAGFAQGLSDRVSGAPLGTGNPASRISSGNIINQAGSILQNPQAAQNLSQALLKEKMGMDFANRGLNNSATAETLSAGVPEIPLSIEGAAKKGISTMADMFNKGQNQRLAQFLYATSPEDKQTLAQALLKYNQ